jgi:hypothetical protein
MFKKIVLFFAAVSVSCLIWAASASAFPGILQLASRAGFWYNQFPPGVLMNHLYYYNFDEVFDEDGDDKDAADTDILAIFNRFVHSWHFGERDKYQFVTEFIVPWYNVSIDDGPTHFNESGLGNPYTYTSIGWNNEAMTTHIQTFLIIEYPLGDEHLQDAGLNHDNFSVMFPCFGITQYLMEGRLQFDLSGGYWHEFESLENDDTQYRPYIELNGCASYWLIPSKFYVGTQVDYTNWINESEIDDVDQDDDGYCLYAAGTLGWWVNNIHELTLKVGGDVDGESTFKGIGVNFRWLWLFG